MWIILWTFNNVSIKSACAMWKVLMVQNWENDVLEGLAIANPFQSQNPLLLVGGTGSYRF
jgi:hypothetical protein